MKVPRDNAWLACLWYAARAATVARHTEAATLLYEELAPWHDQVVWSGASTHGPLATALAELVRYSGVQFDQDVVTAFQKAFPDVEKLPISV